MAERVKGSRDAVLEQGNIYFLYRPKVQEEHPSGKRDVERFYMVLCPAGKKIYREIIIGQKELPESSSSNERNWGFVKKVTKTPQELEQEFKEAEYSTKTRGERKLPAARPAGEGVYAIVRHDDHTHLAYSLELPEKPRKVQQEFRIKDEASYIISIKNPDKPAPPKVGLRSQQKTDYPQKLKDLFRDRRFADADPPDFLNYEGTELILIGTGEDPAELGIALHTEHETEASADIFTDLKLNRKEHPVKPLFEGEFV